MTLFKTTHNQERITPVEVERATPTFVFWRTQVYRRDILRRERRDTMFHRYHDSFELAKHFLIMEREFKKRHALEYVDRLNTSIERLKRKTEPDERVRKNKAAVPAGEIRTPDGSEVQVAG